MRFHSLPPEIKAKEKRKELCSWHKKFAWLPVRCFHEDGEYDTSVWLEYVERKATERYKPAYGWTHLPTSYEWSYRTVEEAGRIRSAQMAKDFLTVSESKKGCNDNCSTCSNKK